MRQHPMLDYIVDFYCAKARLVIELDGMHHGMGEQRQRDIIRDERLESLGCTVLRIANHHVEFDFTAVCRQIDSMIQTLIVTRKSPSAKGVNPSVRQ
jgi:very-short-patch-repair endonuclease